MGKEIRVLIIEDSEDDALLLIRQLRRDGYNPIYQIVDTADKVIQALDSQSWDIVISDYILPEFSGLEALKLIQSKGMDIPCIIVSGRITDETAVSAMRAGARDYVMKDNLKRIGSAIERELAEAETRRARRETEAELKDTAEKLRLVTETIRDVFWIGTPGTGEIVYLSAACEEIWGRSRNELLKTPEIILQSVHPDDRTAYLESMKRLAEGKLEVLEYRIIRPDGSIRWISNHSYPVMDASGKLTMIAGVSRDITRRKTAEETLRKVNRARDVLIKVNEALIRADDEIELLQMVCEIITEVGNYQMSWVGYAMQNESLAVEPVAWAGMEEASLKELSIIANETAAESAPFPRVIHSGELYVARNIKTDPALSAWRQAAQSAGFESAVFLPLKGEKEIFGILSIYASESDRFDSDELQLLSWLASDISFGILALRTRVELENAQSELRAMANRLVQLQEEERRSIARELHDEIGQSLTALKLMITQAARSPLENCQSILQECQPVISELIQQVREMSLKLRPSMLDDLGLLPTLLWYIERYSTQTGIRVNFEHSGLQKQFSQEINTTVYRIVQEALTNAARYAGVPEISLFIRADDTSIHLEVVDRGCGFDPARLGVKASTGLSSMRERAQILGGQLNVESYPGQGTRIIADLPVNSN